jgi:hypothetical protein
MVYKQAWIIKNYRYIWDVSHMFNLFFTLGRDSLLILASKDKNLDEFIRAMLQNNFNVWDFLCFIHAHILYTQFCFHCPWYLEKVIIVHDILVLTFLMCKLTFFTSYNDCLLLLNSQWIMILWVSMIIF